MDKHLNGGGRVLALDGIHSHPSRNRNGGKPPRGPTPDNPHYPYPEEMWEQIKDKPVGDWETAHLTLLRAREGEADAADYAMLERLLRKGTPRWDEVQRLKREKPPKEYDPGPRLIHYTDAEFSLPDEEFDKLVKEKNEKYESEMAAWKAKAAPEQPIFTQAEFDLPKAEFDKLAEERWTRYETELALWEGKNGKETTFQLKKLKFPNDPVDLWQQRKAPALPKGLLPPVIEQFAFQQGELMGADPSGLAMGALVTCAAVIPDSIRIQVKKHDRRWLESTRIWVGLAGPVSAKKSPIMRVVCDPIDDIDKELGIEYANAIAAVEGAALEAKQKKKAALEAKKKNKKAEGAALEAKKEDHPKEEIVRKRIRIEDATPESVQSILEHNHQGVFMKRDELAGWFGQMEKYGGGGRGASADRGFWLQAFNGGYYVWDRVKRGSGTIRNLSVCLLGGIQVEALRRVVEEGVDDGLLQRLFVIMLREAVLGRDEPVEDDQYERLVRKLYGLRQQVYAKSTRKDKPSDPETLMTKDADARIVKFTDEAAAIRWKLEQKHIDLQSAYGNVNRKLASHIGKYDGLFARLCLLWHVIENVDKCEKGFDDYACGCIGAETAQRVADFMHRFLLQHAITFYCNELGLSDDHDRLSAVAGFILARKLDHITCRDVQRGDRTMRKIKGRDSNDLFEAFEALGWLVRKQGLRPSDVIWLVNPAVHVQFEARAKEEAKRREQQHADIVASIRGED